MGKMEAFGIPDTIRRVILNKYNNLNSTEFYAKGHVLAVLDVNLDTVAGKVDAQVHVIKLNETCFSANNTYGIDNANECREQFKSDADLKRDYYEELTPECFMITYSIEDSRVYGFHHVYCFATEDLIDGIDSIPSAGVINAITDHANEQLAKIKL